MSRGARRCAGRARFAIGPVSLVLLGAGCGRTFVYKGWEHGTFSATWEGREKSLPGADADAFDYHLLGTVQVDVGGRWLDRRFAVPIEYDGAMRRVTSLPCQSDGPGLRLRISMEMG